VNARSVNAGTPPARKLPVTLYWPLSHGADGSFPVLIAYATGPRVARLSALDENEAADVVLGDLSRLFPKADPRGTLIARRRIDWGADPYSCGGYTFLKPGGTGARALLAAPDTPPLFWAGSATAWSPIAATVEAAYTSGQRAAGEAIEYLSSRCPDR
jgi:monoamine oxidase